MFLGGYLASEHVFVSLVKQESVIELSILQFVVSYKLLQY